MPMMPGLGRFAAKRLPADAHDAGPVMPMMRGLRPKCREKVLPADAHDAGPRPVCDEKVAG